MGDKIKPDHYHKGGMDVISWMKMKYSPEMVEGFLVGNILKYVTRYNVKNGIEDLRKAEEYLKRLIELKESGERITHYKDLSKMLEENTDEYVNLSKQKTIHPFNCKLCVNFGNAAGECENCLGTNDPDDRPTHFVYNGKDPRSL